MNGWTTLALVSALVVGVGTGLLIGAARWRRAGPAVTGAQLEALLAPAGQALVRVERSLADVERQRIGAYAGLSEQVASLHRSTADLGYQARSLAGALRSPTVRGRWGEMQLRRVVEVAGLVEHCDFDVQPTLTVDGRLQRPDLVVRLAGGRQVPVDAKVPLDAWLAAQQAGSIEEQRRLLTQHAGALRAQVDALAAKAYWRLFDPAPEFVVLFVPGDALLDGALAADPGLLDHAMARHVVMATPATLVALLRTVAFGWKQEQLAASGEEIRRLGHELYSRMGAFADHLLRMGAGLDRAVQAYNAAIGSVESRVLVSARRLADLGVGGEDIPRVPPLKASVRRPRGTEQERPPSPVFDPEFESEVAHLDPTAERIP